MKKHIIPGVVTIIVIIIVNISSIISVYAEETNNANTAMNIVNQYTEKYDTNEINVQALLRMCLDDDLFQNYGVENENAVVDKSTIIQNINYNKCLHIRSHCMRAFALTCVASLFIVVIIGIICSDICR